MTPSLGSSGRVQPPETGLDWAVFYGPPTQYRLYGRREQPPEAARRRTDRPPHREATSRLPQNFVRRTDLETSIAHRARRPQIDDRRPARRRRRRGAAKKIRRSDTTIADRDRNRRSHRTDVSLPVSGSRPWPPPHHQQQRPPAPPPPPQYSQQRERESMGKRKGTR